MNSATALIPATSAAASTAFPAAALAECAAITRRRARNFYHGLRLTPEPRRSAIYSIYAWMREADDVADEPGPIERRRTRLAGFRHATHAVLRDGPAGAPADSPAPAWLWASLSWTMRAFPLEPAILDDMLDGLENELLADSRRVLFDTEADLSRYCYQVAGTAGLACLWVWGLRSSVPLKNGRDADSHEPPSPRRPGSNQPQLGSARELAVLRGEAFQRTNILRDFMQDYDGDPPRVYLAAESLAAKGITDTDLRAWSPAGACREFIAEQAAIARSCYKRSAGLEELIDPACVPTLWAMTRIYSEILSIIERDPGRVVGSRRIRLSGVRKAAIALRAGLSSRATRGSLA